MKLLISIFIVIAVTVASGGPTPPSITRRSIEDVRGGSRAFQLQEVSAQQMDRRTLTKRAARVLAIPGIKWKHAQSDHFVLHYERKMFARRVGRMAEFFYQHIADDFQMSEDIVDGRSHIFIFRSREKWSKFIAAENISLEWAFSIVSGPTMYLQEADKSRRSANVLAHEMTHLVVNRFFKNTPPIWLNEGLAEWYEEFGYASFKGVKKSKRPQFRKLRSMYPIRQLLSLKTYPVGDSAIRSFYQTSKFLVGYLMLKWPSSLIVDFAEDLGKGRDVEEALASHYKIKSIRELEKNFKKFTN